MNMAAPMFALQPIPNPTFDIEFGKVLPHRSYTAAELQTWLNKLHNPSDASWIVTINVGGTITVDGRGIRFNPIAISNGLFLDLYFKDRTNFIAYLKMIGDYNSPNGYNLHLSEYGDANGFTFSFANNIGTIFLRQTFGGVPTTIYSRTVPYIAGIHPMEMYIESYTKRFKFWAVTDIPGVNTNGWQHVATTLASPTNKRIRIAPFCNGVPLNPYMYIQKLQVKFMDGVFT